MKSPMRDYECLCNFKPNITIVSTASTTVYLIILEADNLYLKPQWATKAAL